MKRKLGALGAALAIIASGQVNANVDGLFGGRVWLDENRNGIQEADENDSCPMRVFLDKLDEPRLWLAIKTDKEGNYLFPEVPLGDYRVRFERSEGYVFTTPNVGNNDNIDSDAAPGRGAAKPFRLTAQNPSTFNVDAGYVECPTRCERKRVRVYNDRLSFAYGAYFTTNVTANDFGAGTVSVKRGPLPAGVTLTADGTLSGTPIETGTFKIIYELTSSECSKSKGRVFLTVD
ncbi:MAG: SdrD B-like domain-containing protein [Pseudomonadota bacterium]